MFPLAEDNSDSTCHFFLLTMTTRVHDFTSAGLVVQRPPKQNGMHQFILCLSALKGFGEGQVGHLGREKEEADVTVVEPTELEPTMRRSNAPLPS